VHPPHLDVAPHPEHGIIVHRGYPQFGALGKHQLWHKWFLANEPLVLAGKWPIQYKWRFLGKS